MSTLCILVFSQLFTFVLSTPPNIIFFLADDLGYDDVGFQSNNQIHTPNIDKLHSDGQFLEWYYGQPVCSPTRTAIMTGKYPLHNSINTIIQPNQAYGVPLSNILFPQILKQNGYETHAIGKWHMGFFKWAYTPTFRGFQSFYGYYTGAEDYFNHVRSNYYDFRDDNGVNCGANCSRVASEAKGVYSAFAFTTRAIEIIRNHNKTKPLFIYLPYQSVHEPNQVPQQYEEAYNRSITNKKRRTFAGMLSCLDEAIGNITNVLSELGYLNDTNGNTIIIFSSDNGGPVPNKTGSSNIPLRGGKGSIWEGGVRLTASIYATADLIPKSLRGTNYTQLMHVVDWYPTLLSMAGIDINKINETFDGVNHWNGINGHDNNDDKYFKYRDYVYHGYRDTGGPWAGYNNTAFRYEWNKLINGTAGTHNSWYPPPEPNMDISYDGYNSNSAYLYMEACKDNDLSQEWQYNEPEKVVYNRANNVCIFVTGKSNPVGTRMCNYNDKGQQFNYNINDKQFKSVEYKNDCLDIAHKTSDIDEWQCKTTTGVNNQQFDLNTDSNTIHAVQNNSNCLTLKWYNSTQPMHIFNIQNDPYEYSDIVGENTTLLDMLWNMMLQIESSGIPQATPDNNCPPITHPNDSVVGGVWAPWCD